MTATPATQATQATRQPGSPAAGARVVLVQTRLPRYREPVFQALRDALATQGIAFDLVHGQPTAAERRRGDEGALPWAQAVPNRYLTVRGTALVWQGLPACTRQADLLILTQENRILSNYPALAWPRASRRVAFFGHGRNFQARAPGGLAERFKRRLIHAVDWWFAYTELSRDWLIGCGYPAGRITSVDNAMDVDGLRADLHSARAQGLPATLRAELGIAPQAPVGLYCGALYAEKRLDLLVAAAQVARAHGSDLHLLVIGDGPLGPWLREQAATRPWLHALGARHGVPKAACFAAADVVLNPGLVGLHVLDAFAAGLPMITTRDAAHSPEIAYLQDGVNGLLADGNAQAFASASLALLADPATHDRLASAAGATADRFTVNHMARRFAQGIVECLSAPPQGRTARRPARRLAGAGPG